MVADVFGRRSPVQIRDGLGHEVHRHDVHAIGRTKGEHRQPREKGERTDHVELRGFRPAAVAEDDARPENRDRHVAQQAAHHLLAAPLRARVRIVVGPRPVERLVFPDDLVAAVAGDGHGADVADAPDGVIRVRGSRQRDHFERPANVDVEADAERPAVERCGAVHDRRRRRSQLSVLALAEPESRRRQIADDDRDARSQPRLEPRKVDQQLQRSPEPMFGIASIAGPNQQQHTILAALEEFGRDVRADVAGGARQERAHVIRASTPAPPRRSTPARRG